MPTSDVISANRTHPDFRYSRPTSASVRVADDELKENHRPIDDDVTQPHFRFAASDRNRKWKSSAMRRTSTARSSLQSYTVRLVPEVSAIRPEIDEAGTLLSDDSSIYDVDDMLSVTENQPGVMYLPKSK